MKKETKEKRATFTPGDMKHYQIEVLSSVCGYISINAKSEEDAVQQIENEVGEYGVEPLIDKLYRNNSKKYRDYTGAEVTYRDEQVSIDSIISDEPFDRHLVVGDKKYNSKTGKWTIGGEE
tara:strand:+ start:338 stop:700 length:363 start_codon:yes stop_codon:yes gene_type:complete